MQIVKRIKQSDGTMNEEVIWDSKVAWSGVQCYFQDDTFSLEFYNDETVIVLTGTEDDMTYLTHIITHAIGESIDRTLREN